MPSAATFSTQLLQDLGYETTWAAGGEEALTILLERSHGFDAVFSDVVMPGMNGVDLGREIRRLYPSMRVILTSGYSDVLAGDTRHRAAAEALRGREPLSHPAQGDGRPGPLRTQRGRGLDSVRQVRPSRDRLPTFLTSPEIKTPAVVA